MSRDRGRGRVGPDRARAHTTTRRRAHALLGGVADRAIELAVLAALTAAAVVVSWWFVVPAVAGAAWWASAEVRLRRRLRRARPATTAPVTDAAVTVLARPESRDASAGVQADGRAS